MAFTTADLTALDRAIAASELEVELEGRRVRFDNFAGLVARRDFIVGQLANASVRRRSSYKFQFTTLRGD